MIVNHLGYLECMFLSGSRSYIKVNELAESGRFPWKRVSLQVSVSVSISLSPSENPSPPSTTHSSCIIPTVAPHDGSC